MKTINQKVASDMGLLLKTAQKIEPKFLSVTAEKEKCCECEMCGDKCSCCGKCSQCSTCEQKTKKASRLFVILNKIAECLDLAGLDKSAAQSLILLDNLSKEASGIKELNDSMPEFDELRLQEKLDELGALDIDLDGDVEEDIGNTNDKRKQELELEADEFLATHPEKKLKDDLFEYVGDLSDSEEDIFNSNKDKTEFNDDEDIFGENTEDLIHERLDMERIAPKIDELNELHGFTPANKEKYRGLLYGPEYFSDERDKDLDFELEKARGRKAAGRKFKNKFASSFDEWSDTEKLFSDKDFERDDLSFFEGRDPFDLEEELKPKKLKTKVINQFQQKKKNKEKEDLFRKILKETPETQVQAQDHLNIDHDIKNLLDEKDEPEDIEEIKTERAEKIQTEDENYSDDGIESCGTCGYDHGLEFELLSFNELKAALQAHKDAGDYEALGMKVPDFLLEDENDISDNLARETDEILWKLKKDRSRGRNVRRISDLAKNKGMLPSEQYFDEEHPEDGFDLYFPEDKSTDLEKYIPKNISEDETVKPNKMKGLPFDWEPESDEWIGDRTEIMMPKSAPTPYEFDEEELIETQRKPALIDDMKAANRKLDQMLKVLAKETSKEEEDEDFEDEE